MHVFDSIAIVASPPWHRRERARRARARHRLRDPTAFPAPLIRQDVRLLEKHHSRPQYSRERLGMSWNGKQWTGNYWGQKKPKGKGKGQKSDTKDKNKEKGGDKVVFPTYDAMAVGPSQGSSSASASSGSEAVWQQALKSLIVSNPNLTVPKEVSEVLDESMTSDTKRDLYAQQRALNARRKASQRLERLQNALTRQKLQMQAYQEHMRQQLKTEMDRFRTEQKELEQKVEEAKTTLQKIEAGEEVSAMEEVNVDPVDVSLADMLGITPQADAMVRKARQEKEEAFAMVHQLQTQIHMIMQNGAAQSNLGNMGTDQMNAMLQQHGASTYSPIRSSPQAPVGPFQRHKAEKTQPGGGRNEAPVDLENMG